jgi:BCD family chlorophyll transporter-like MFS transporter
VQASAAGVAIASGGLMSDAVSSLARAGRLGPTFVSPAVGYTAVYTTELILLFGTLIALGPLAGRPGAYQSPSAAALNELASSAR